MPFVGVLCGMPVQAHTAEVPSSGYPISNSPILRSMSFSLASIYLKIKDNPTNCYRRPTAILLSYMHRQHDPLSTVLLGFEPSPNCFDPNVLVQHACDL